jgi:hypothetical protein
MSLESDDGCCGGSFTIVLCSLPEPSQLSPPWSRLWRRLPTSHEKPEVTRGPGAPFSLLASSVRSEMGSSEAIVAFEWRKAEWWNEARQGKKYACCGGQPHELSFRECEVLKH